MKALAYERPADLDQAIAAVGGNPAAAYLAGGTTEIDLLLKDGVLDTERLVDITRLPLRGITHGVDAIQVGALTTMEELAADPLVTERLPFVREALLAGASVQLRNMATIGGNILQRTRCRYFRDRTVSACNKRNPGSGCAALDGFNRMHAIVGVSDHCIALHASDLAVALIALDAVVQTKGPNGERSIPLTEFYRTPGETPWIEHALDHGELITAVSIPLLPDGSRSHYLKVRDRASYEFALSSAAVALTIDQGTITSARIGLGGIGTIPWRGTAAEAVLAGAPVAIETFRAAAVAAVAGAVPRAHNAFKIELAKRTLIRALSTVTGVE
jgi:xanthine dehydrogenase YagS FAD-binding subunit